MTTTRRKTRKRRIGTSLILFSLLVLSCALQAQTNKKAPGSYGLIGGSVYDPSGRAFPHATATLTPDPQSGSASLKMKKLEAVSDSRGEFVFRVPAAPMHYILRVAAKGFEPQEKPVDITADERVDVTFQLEPESKR